MWPLTEWFHQGASPARARREPSSSPSHPPPTSSATDTRHKVRDTYSKTSYTRQMQSNAQKLIQATDGVVTEFHYCNYIVTLLLLLIFQYLLLLFEIKLRSVLPSSYLHCLSLTNTSQTRLIICVDHQVILICHRAQTIKGTNKICNQDKILKCRMIKYSF